MMLSLLYSIEGKRSLYDVISTVTAGDFTKYDNVSYVSLAKAVCYKVY